MLIRRAWPSATEPSVSQNHQYHISNSKHQTRYPPNHSSTRRNHYHCTLHPPSPPPKRVDSDRNILVRSMASSAALCGPVTASLHPSATHAVSHSFTGRRLRLGCSTSPARGCRRAVPAGDQRGAPSFGRLAVRCAGIETIVESEFEAEVLGAEVPVLVEFYAEWCGPCRLVTPFVEWASQEYKGRLKVVKIDHDANPQLIKEYKVYGLPALILFRNGIEVPGSRKEGAITKVKLKEYLDSLLDSTPVS